MSIKAGNQLIFILSSGDKISLTAMTDAVPNVTAEKAPEAYEAVLEIFTGSGARNSQKSSANNVTSKYAIFPISLDQINKLANAKDANFAVYADKQRIERKIGKSQIDIYKEFNEKVLKIRLSDSLPSAP
jgi:ribosomal protein L31E